MPGPLQLKSQFFGGKYASATLNTAAGTTPKTILQVPSGLYAYILGVQITIDPICTINAAGMQSTSLTTLDGGETIATLRSFIPASFVSLTAPAVNRQTGAPDAFFATTVQGETIQAVNSVALTAGSIRISFNYGFSNAPIGNFIS